MIKGKEFGVKRMMQWEILGLFLLLSLFSVSKSWAVGNIHLGLMEVHPGFQVKQTYYQRINEDDPDSSGDWVTTYSPGIKMNWPIRQHTIKADWLFGFNRYHKNKNQNYTGENLSTNGNFVFGQGGRQITLNLGHTQIVTDDAGYVGESRRKRRENRLASKLGVNFNNNLRLDFSYGLNTYRYDNRGGENYDLDNVNLNQFETAINVRVQPKTEAFISGRYYQYNYQYDHNGIDDDSSSWTVGPGIRWDATAKLSGQISGGFSQKSYKNGENINTWVVAVDLTHHTSDFTKISLGLDKGDRDHSLSGRENFDNYAFNQGRLSLDHQLTYKVKFLSGFTYEYDKYRGIDRQDNIYAWRLGLNYQIQEWLVTNLGFEQRHRDCHGNDDLYLESDYNDNICSLSLGLAL